MSVARNHQGRRRSFLARSSALAASLLLGMPRISSAEPPPEVTRIRLVDFPAICLAPQYLAEELLRLEGFSDVEYVKFSADNPSAAVAEGRADFTMDTAPFLVAQLDAGKPILPLAGVHDGCYELFGNDRIQKVRDLKGKSVAVSEIGAGDYIFISSIAAYYGLDPRRDINWVATHSFANSMQSFINGKVDAFLAFEPQPHELRALNVGNVIIDTTYDRPWSQYFCCMVTSGRDFAQQYPIATKRALRAFLKATDICAREPERAARYLAAKGFEPRVNLSLNVLKSLPYRRWRETDPEDTLRFHALRLREAGLINSSPHQIIAQGTDWRFLNELKKELKA
jgi:NitT/TauT family transport system substrate-binding protein